MEYNAPLDTQVEITKRCNHNCWYCYNSFEHNADSMDRGLFKVVAEELIKNRVFDVVLTGGEPFLNKDVLFYGIDYLFSNKVNVSVNTNLSNEISGDEARFIRGKSSVMFSLPSYHESTFIKITGAPTFKRVLKNIEALVDLGTSISANQVVTLENIEEVYDTGKFLFEKFGIPFFSATPVNVNQSMLQRDSRVLDETSQYVYVVDQLCRLREDLGIKVNILTCYPRCLFPEEYQDEKIIQKTCQSGSSTLAVGIDGKVRKCIFDEEIIGDLKKEELSKVWKRAKSQKRTIPSTCGGCGEKEMCLGGCEVRLKKSGYKDHLIKGPIKKREKRKVSFVLDPDKYYKLKPTRFREENTTDKYLFLSNEKYTMFGNDALLKMLRVLSKKTIKPSKLGKEMLDFLNYLNRRGFVEESAQS